MSLDAIRALHVVVGLGAGVTVTGVRDRDGGPLEIGIELTGRPCCGGCGGPVWAHGASTVKLADLPAFGRAVRLGWRKRRWRCPDGSCAVRTFTDQDPEIVAMAKTGALGRDGPVRPVPQDVHRRVGARPPGG